MPVIPKSFLRLRKRYLLRKFDRGFANRSPREAFSAIYEKRIWGDGGANAFFSGAGSHDPEIVSCYVDATRQLLKQLGRPEVVDLGCGDFSVGKQLRTLCGNYVACDVVPSLVEYNQQVFRELGVDFRCLDITQDTLPGGTVAVIRQVFQHLSNSQILKVIPKLKSYKFLLVTEHLPTSPDFVPNIDRPIGAGIRIGLNSGDSGVVLTAPPFNLLVKTERVICQVPVDERGTIRTVFYEMN
jgi:SAM-dependent methyltransferase